MAEKVIKSKPNNPREFVIPAAKGSSNQRAVTLVLPKNVDPERYVIVKKNVPQMAWSKGRSKKITWINNFGVKQGNKFVGKINYHILADAPPKGKSYFYFDGENVQPFAAGDIDKSGRKWVLKIHSGDPAVGWGGSGP